MDLYGLKEDSMEVGKLGASALVGAAIAKQVVGLKALDSLPAAKWIKPLIPIAVGVGVHSYGKNQFPIAAPGVAAGMVAVGVAALVKAAVAGTSSDAMISSYLPFNGLGELGYVYDYSLQGLGYGPGDVTRYMNGAPTQVQSLMGAPLQVQALAGLGAAPTTVSVAGPMSATLM